MVFGVAFGVAFGVVEIIMPTCVGIFYANFPFIYTSHYLRVFSRFAARLCIRITVYPFLRGGAPGLSSAQFFPVLATERMGKRNAAALTALAPRRSFPRPRHDDLPRPPSTSLDRATMTSLSPDRTSTTAPLDRSPPFPFPFPFPSHSLDRATTTHTPSSPRDTSRAQTTSPLSGAVVNIHDDPGTHQKGAPFFAPSSSR